MDNIYLYLLMRNDLSSLNSGKAVAHGAHAANQAVFEITNRYTRTSERGKMLRLWQDSTSLGFGTTIALTVNLAQLETSVKVAQALGHDAGITIDPTYPYMVDSETSGLIDPETITSPSVPLGKGGVMMFREEITAGYVFGIKNDLKIILGNFPLMP